MTDRRPNTSPLKQNSSPPPYSIPHRRRLSPTLTFFESLALLCSVNPVLPSIAGLRSCAGAGTL
uniref:Uncharacterized protein n=1 Tax=Hordeum vulgare subsp. vulgare TaxID=112509 RepID=A0A8I6XDL2_HORVV